MVDSAPPPGNRAWDSTDAWVLAAASPRRRGGTLSQIIGSGDAINHDILTRDALASSLGALRGAGLVEVVSGKIRLTRAGRQMKRQWRGGVFNWGPTLLPELARAPRPSEIYDLTPEEWNEAYNAYRNRMKRWIK